MRVLVDDSAPFAELRNSVMRVDGDTSYLPY